MPRKLRYRNPLYIAGKKPDAFPQVLQSFAKLRTATETALETGLSRRSVNATFMLLRARIREEIVESPYSYSFGGAALLLNQMAGGHEFILMHSHDAALAIAFDNLLDGEWENHLKRRKVRRIGEHRVLHAYELLARVSTMWGLQRGEFYQFRLVMELVYWNNCIAAEQKSKKSRRVASLLEKRSRGLRVVDEAFSKDEYQSAFLDELKRMLAIRPLGTSNAVSPAHRSLHYKAIRWRKYPPR